MGEKVPRRMMRFSRKNNADGDEQNYSGANNYREVPQEGTLSGAGQIPSMNYEDVASSKKNELEKKKSAQENLEKIALGKVEEFKKQYNRMPSKEESDQMAESLYSQFKNTNLENIYPEEENLNRGAENANTEERRGRHHARGEERNQPKARGSGQVAQQQGSPQQPQSNVAATDLKALLGEDGKKSKKSASDEFDLNLEEGNDAANNTSASASEDIGEIESIEIGDKSVCPNCGKETDQIIFCSNCGFSFCNKCSKKEGAKYICPKCGTKNEA
ncbi:DNA polymerase II large subunit [uncultured archaeon]|nr:DNA polymerase II large subunit [uncultured archaeon]